MKLKSGILKTSEPYRPKTYLMTCAHKTKTSNEDSDQPAHTRSLIRVFIVRIKKHHWLSKIRTVKILTRLRECAGWSESSLSEHAGRTGHVSWSCVLFCCTIPVLSSVFITTLFCNTNCANTSDTQCPKRALLQHASNRGPAQYEHSRSLTKALVAPIRNHLLPYICFLRIQKGVPEKTL